MNKSLLRDWYELKAEVLGLLGEPLVKAEVLFELFPGEDRFVVCLAGGEQVVEDAS